MIILEFVSVIFLLFIAIQDFKERSIFAWLPIAIFSIFFLRSYLIQGLQTTLSISCINSFVIILQLAFLFIYFSIKKKKIYNIVDTQLGLGDVFFLFSLTPFFSVYNFILFFTISLLTIISFYLIALNKKNISMNIPLAGILSLYIVIIISISFFIKSVEVTDDFLFY